MAGYLGDKQTMIVHHLANMKNECGIYSIQITHREYFTPDSLENAKKLGFNPCPYCN